MASPTLKISLAAFLAVYASVGLATEIALPGHEKSAIPFFSWFLFTRVPNQMHIYAVRVLEYEGRTLEPPVLLQGTIGIMANPFSPKTHVLIQEWGRSIAAGATAERQRLRKIFENTFLRPPVRYELILLTYDPLERWRNGTIRITPIEEFAIPGEMR